MQKISGFTKLCLILMLAAFATSCGNKTNEQSTSTARNALQLNTLPDTTLDIVWKKTTRKVILLPAHSLTCRGNILLLHGWNLSPSGWCEQTSLCDSLRNAGFNIIIPDMGKSLYATRSYPETMGTMAEQPLRSWLTDTVLVILSDSFQVFTKETKNFVVGLSTGARGAFAIGLDKTDLFDGAVLLSGDYDQTRMSDDNIMTFFYGSYEEFPERWKGEDNLLKRAGEWKLPVYIGHAKQDPVVPCEQSELLYKALIKADNVKPESNFPSDFGHDYTYWESESANILNFIRSICDRELTSEK